MLDVATVRGMLYGPFRATVQNTELVTLYAVEDATGRALVFWFVPSIQGACISTPQELFEIMNEGTRG
jgi:hypothetical protein